ncbi:unnamed protein product [Amaranthus hypochondriacus]
MFLMLRINVGHLICFVKYCVLLCTLQPLFVVAAVHYCWDLFVGLMLVMINKNIFWCSLVCCLLLAAVRSRSCCFAGFSLMFGAGLSGAADAFLFICYCSKLKHLMENLVLFCTIPYSVQL